MNKARGRPGYKETRPGYKETRERRMGRQRQGEGGWGPATRRQGVWHGDKGKEGGPGDKREVGCLWLQGVLYNNILA